MNHIPPQNVAVERHVLGACLLTDDAVSVVLEALDVSDFYTDPHKSIFSAIRSLAAKNCPCDLFTISSELRILGKFESSGGEAHLLTISSEVVTDANVAEHCEILKDASLKRKQIGVAAAAIERGYSDESGKDTQEYLEREVFRLGVAESDKKTLRPMRDVLKDSLRALETRKSGTLVGLPTGIPCLDFHMGGMQKGDNIVLGARPAQGKTSLAAQIGVHNAKAGQVVARYIHNLIADFNRAEAEVLALAAIIRETPT